MAAYTKRPKLFNCRGMNLNRAIEQIPENEFAYLKNVRQYVEGKLESRPGLLPLSSNALGVGNIHSYTQLNNFGGVSKQFLGIRDELRWADVAIPVPFTFVDSGFSGNPLSFIPYSPEQTPIPFLYVYDSNKQAKYSAAYTSAGVAIGFEIGIPLAPIYQAGPPVPNISGGDVTGTGYSWRWQLRHTISGAVSIPGTPTYTPIDLTAEEAEFDDPNEVITGIAARDAEYTWDLYRIGGTESSWRYVGSVINGSGLTIVDDFTDLDLASSIVLDVSPAAIKYQPWLSPDTPRSGPINFTTAAVPTSSGVGGDGSLVNGNGFNIDWIPGTTIIVNGRALTVARVISPQNLYVTQDLGGDIGAGDWSEMGAIQSSVNLPFVWGPYGAGQFGLYLFACGNPLAPGTVYWTIGNDPDSVGITNSLQITDSSEPLQNGCVWNGRIYVWSADRMWELSPDLVNQGQFVAQVIPGAKGLPYNWCFCVGDFVYWLSKDGVYKFNGAQAVSISDDQLYDLLGHDGNQGIDVFLPNPDNFGGNLVIKAPDVNQPDKLRMNWTQGVLHFDYPGNDGSNVTLVYDSHVMKGWTLDQYKPYGGFVAHFSVPEFNQLVVALANKLYYSTGNDDDGETILCQIMSGADLLGNLRSEKVVGDATVGVNMNGFAGGTAQLLINQNTASLSGVVPLSGTSGYNTNILNGNFQPVDGNEAYSQTAGIWISAESTAALSFFDWEVSYVDKPDTTQKRATDWTDDGEPGDKFLYGCLIEANTFGQNRTVQIYGDDNQLIATLTVNHPVQQTKPYHFTPPLITHQMRAVPTDENTWDLFKIVWKWNPKPELTQWTMDWTDDGKPVPKYLMGFVLEADTLGQDVSMELWADGQLVQTFTVNHDGQLEKPYPTTNPPIIHEMRLIPSGNDIRYLPPFKIGWHYTEHPELTTWVEDFTSSDPVSYRGVAIEADTEGQDVEVRVISAEGLQRTLIVNHPGRMQKAYSFLEPFITTEIKLVPIGTPWRHYTTRWIGDPRPDLAPLYTDWTDDGYESSKFFQGFTLWADTQGADIEIRVEYDGGQLAQVFTKVNHNGDMQFEYSFNEPFVAHQVRIIPSGALRYQGPWKIRWIWEPAPDLAKHWHTQTTSHGLRGFHHHRDCYTALQSFANVLLRVTLDDGNVFNYIIPSTGGAIRKPYEVLEPMKAKLSQYSLISCKPFRLFKKDCEMRVKEWGATGEFISERPYGGQHFADGAKI